MPFYKKIEDELLSAPTFVHGPDFQLTLENKDEHTYPVDGWYWFDNLEEALLFFTKPIVVNTISRRQGRRALLETPYQGGNMLDAVESLIWNIQDPLVKRQAEIDYEADVWEMSNPTLQQMWAALGGSTESLEALFAHAKTL